MTFPAEEAVGDAATAAEFSSDLRARYGLRSPDAIQVATAVHQRADSFVTNDAGLRRIKEIQVMLARVAE